jgi:hypothetical protein
MNHLPVIVKFKGTINSFSLLENSLKKMVKIKSVLVCIHFLLIGCLYLNSIYGFSQQVSVEEVYKEMKTYPFSDPSPVPKVGRIYPYFRFDGYTDEAIQKKWKFVELQNEFIKVSITPQIGGKIWGAIDKTSNFPFIYYNNVVKFRDVAMRGAWTSGGIELNFGDIGHDPTVSNPVDYFTRKNNDGSVSCFLASYDWASRTRWLVEVNLPKNKVRRKSKQPPERLCNFLCFKRQKK